MNLFESIVSPFIFLIEYVFLLSYQLVGNYGFAIVLLSLFISVLLLPIFIFIEKAKRKDDAIKYRMKPLVDEIKRCYKGQERFYYLKTLNRQYNYSPLRSLIPILSLLVQIPFFIAAYQYLESFEPLSGVSFLFINDLSLPDGVMDNINILPIIMTLVNLIAAYFYTKNGDGSERKQMLIVAGVFLVLLFDLPSGLVLYWTMNNVFSFFRLFITNPEVFKRRNLETNKGKISKQLVKGRFVIILPKLKGVFYLLAMTAVASQINWAINNDFNDIIVRIPLSIIASLILTGIVVLIAVFHKVENENEFNGVSFLQSRAWVVYRPMFIFFILISILSQISWALQFNFDTIIQRIVVCVIISIFLTFLFYLVNSYLYRLPFGNSKISRAKSYSLVPLMRKSYKHILSFKISSSISYLIVALSFYFYFSGLFYHQEVNGSLLKIALVFFLVALLIGFLLFIKYFNVTSLPKKYSVAGVLVLSILFLSIRQGLLSNTLSNSNILFELFFNEVPIVNHINIIILNLIMVFSFYTKERNTAKLVVKTHKVLIFYLSILYVLLFAFIWNPIIVYSSHPQNFNFPGVNIIANNYFYVVVLLIFFSIIFFLRKKHQSFLAIFVLFLALISFLYSSIIPFDVGTLQDNLFSEDQNLLIREDMYVLEALLLLSLFVGVNWIIKKNHNRIIVIALIGLNLIPAVQSFNKGMKTGTFWHLTNQQSNDSNTPQDSPDAIQFSKDKENVVLFIVDAAQGWYMNELVKEDSTLKKKYDGFTYYPNNVAASNFTYSSVPSIMSGDEYLVGNMNKDKSTTIKQKITQSTEDFYSKIKERGFRFTSTIMRYSSIDENKFDAYIPTWHSEWATQLGLDPQRELWFNRLWENALFNMVPVFLKARIYNDKNWLVKSNSSLNTSNLVKYHFVKMLPLISENNGTEPNFIYIHSLFTHVPWNVITEDNELNSDVSPYEVLRWFTNEFVNWIDWMKENDVYDNTKIVLVSDHGPSWFHYKKDWEVNAPIQGNDWKGMSKGAYFRLNSLFMVKDFQSRGYMKEDWRLMCSSDVPSVIFDENNPTSCDSTGRVVKTYYNRFHTGLGTKKEYDVNLVFEIKDNVYNLDNWKQIK